MLALSTEAERWDALIIGGGPAGAAAACHLARAGKRTLLIEKERRAHHKVCGEFLSFEAQTYLRELGVDALRLGAVPIRYVRLINGERIVQAPLPFRALGLSRFILDESLLELAAARGVAVRRGYKVRRILPIGDLWTAQAHDLLDVQAHAVFLATGKHDLTGLKRPPGKQNGLIGFKMHFTSSGRRSRALANHVDVVLFDSGYAGLQPVENQKANLCLVIDKHRFAELGKRWNVLLAHLARSSSHLRSFLNEATPCSYAPEAIASLPYGYVHAGNGDSDIYRLGDQFAVIPSFSGEGMSIALHTARLAANAFLSANRGSEIFHHRARKELSPQMRAASAIGSAIANPAARRLGFATCKAFPSLVSRMVSRTRLETFPSPGPR